MDSRAIRGPRVRVAIVDWAAAFVCRGIVALRGARTGLRPVEMIGSDLFQLVIVLLTRCITSAKFAPKASAVFRSPEFISSTEASEGETATKPTKPPR